MPLSVLDFHVSDLNPSAAGSFRSGFALVDNCLGLLASDSMRALATLLVAEIGLLEHSHLRPVLIVVARSCVRAASLLHVASVSPTVVWTTIEVCLAPSSSAALEVALLETHIVGVHP